MIPSFASMDWFTTSGDSAAVVLLDRETSDFAHLLGQPVKIDETLFFCTGVDRFAHAPPWRRGERIALRLGSPT